MPVALGKILFHTPPPDWSQLEAGADLTVMAVTLLVLVTGVLLARQRRFQPGAAPRTR